MIYSYFQCDILLSATEEPWLQAKNINMDSNLKGIDTYLLHRPEPDMGHEDKSVEHAPCNTHRSHSSDHLTLHLIYSLQKDL